MIKNNMNRTRHFFYVLLTVFILSGCGESVNEKNFDISMQKINGEWISEDLLFCRKIKHLGFPIHANTSVILPHQKRYWLHEGHHTERQNNEDI